MASNGQIPCARAIHDFLGEADHELSFSAGVSIMLLRRIDDNWLEGKLNSKVGIFPSNYVKIQLGSPSVPHENDLASSGKPYAIALHPFISVHPGDLSFSKGDLVELVGVVGSGWLRGKVKDEEGIFPGSFVKILRDPPTSDENPGDEGDVFLTTHKPFKEDMKYPKPHPRKVSAPNLPLGRGEALYEEVPDLYEKLAELNEEAPPTPSRSAPAPPNKHNKQDGYATLPIPKPRKKPLKRHTSLTNSDQRLQNLESDLKIENKMLESAQNLLCVSQSEVKMEKLRNTVVTHQSNIQRIICLIDVMKAEGDSLADSTVPPPLPPPRPAPPISSQLQQRLKVINELVHTERDFHHQVQLCVSKVVPSLQKISEINIELLFGNLEDVAGLSGQFLSSLEESCQDHQSVGGVFVSYASRLKDVYAFYCRNHDNASAILEKYMESPYLAEEIRHCMDALRNEIQAWDLQSFLIKPVQRVLKYPLLLRKLVETTPDKHPDHTNILNARDAIFKMAQDINEIKRRKDIVERYTGPAKEDRRGTLSKHSIQKKVRRMQQAFVQFTGLRSKTIDPKFDEIEQKVLSLETSLRTMLKDITSWLDELQHVMETRETLRDGMTLYVSDVDSLTDFETILSDTQQAIKTHTQFIKDFVTTPLDTLIGLFEDPLHLIHKRRDKLLDYDHTQYAYEHAEEPEKIKQLKEVCLLARRNYEALNTQLLEELPHFLEASVNMLQHQVMVFVQAQYSFHSDMSKLFYPVCQQIETSTEIQLKHAVALAVISQRLTQLSLVPASLAMNFTTKTVIPKRASVGSSSPSDGSPLSPHDSLVLKSLVSPPQGGVLSLAEEMEEAEDLDEGTVLEVLYDFSAQDSAEVSVVSGEKVTLHCTHDRIGCKEWWLVETESGERGYVPATYMETPKRE